MKPAEKPVAPKREGRRRGIYFIPSAFTVGNIFCGYYAIICSMQGWLELAAVLIGFAILLDTLDGRVARMADATSEFGREFDSLADVISFGVAPGVLAYTWGLKLWPRVGWLACFLFVICGAMRLARFNIQQKAVDKRFFVGLPIPAAAAVMASLVFMFPEPLAERQQTILPLLLMVALALLMVSTVRYYAFKDIDLRSRQPHLAILLLALFFIIIGSHPQVTLLAMSSIYVLSGPTHRLYAFVRRRTSPAPAPPPQPVAEGPKELDS
jgi:CDP-diacylglycerol--serine O-phosphatidyltransferase